MDHEEVLKEIVNYLSNCEQLKTVNIFSQYVERVFENTLFSLFRILEKQCCDFISSVQELETANGLSLNDCDIKPSFNEMYCMCKSIEQLFEDETIDKRVSQIVSCYMKYCLSHLDYDKLQLCIYDTFFNAEQRELSFIDSSYGFFVYFYYYLFIVLEKNGLIDDEYEPWDENLIETAIYLPLEGMVNLVYFNFLINPQKECISELICEKDISFNDRKISQYDCGFKGELPKNLNLSEKQFTFWLDPDEKIISGIENDDLKKSIRTPLHWLRCFHVVRNIKETDLSVLKIIKLLYDTGSHSEVMSSEIGSIYKVLANVDEGNYNVRGVWCNNLYGDISTCIKSIVFRDLSLDQIDILEKLHETILGHIGSFANYRWGDRISDLDDSSRKNLFKASSDIVDGYEFNILITDNLFSNNALVQLVAWQFLSEFYAYIKTNLIITEYIISNYEGICKEEGYTPEQVPLDYCVLLGNLKLVKVSEDNKPKDTECEIEYFYNGQPAFIGENISDLIKQTRIMILNYWADSLLEIRGEQNCTLRQFLTASLLLVKSKKGKKIFSKAPDYTFYGHSTERNSIGKILRGNKRDLKNVALVTRLLEAQNQVFINPDFLLSWNKLIKQGYMKMLLFMEQQIPFLKDGKKASEKENMKSQKRYVTPYEVLLSLQDITINVFDKILDEILP